MADAPRVFLSYSHDSDEHADRVLALANALCARGIDVILDRFVHPAPAEGWPLWMERNLEAADFILLVCTATYRRRVRAEEMPGQGTGVRWEGRIVYNHLCYGADPGGIRFIPILLPGAEPTHIPDPVRGHNYYRITAFDLSDPGFEALYRHLTDQPAALKPGLGAVVILPPKSQPQPLPGPLPPSGDDGARGELMRPQTQHPDALGASVIVPGSPGTLVIIDTPQVAREQQEHWADRLGVDISWTNRLGITFQLIPPGRFFLGASPGDRSSRPDESPRLNVTMDRPFRAAVFPITNAVIRRFLEEAAGEGEPEIVRLIRDRAFARRCRQGFVSDELPAVELSVHDAEVLCLWMGRLDGRVYRLPTEAEWEYIARAGSRDRYWWGNDDDPRSRAVYAVSGPAALSPSRANAWGLIDTLGNVAEWTSSAYAPLSDGAATRPASLSGGKNRIVRGGSWRDRDPTELRVSRRRSMSDEAHVDYLGLRLLCDLGRETS